MKKILLKKLLKKLLIIKRNTTKPGMSKQIDDAIDIANHLTEEKGTTPCQTQKFLAIAASILACVFYIAKIAETFIN
ncbi:hypothetical protein [Piscirickettsia salmonis]|uniref:hypothetical protein n=1 Tax=Piscirickettsia salmonis TaxID=1238 RepID=UPI0007C8D00D|nr:hypothetical protein A0O36_02379 [Piscirickettsiaceae bacterium NZ-RLO1]